MFSSFFSGAADPTAQNFHPVSSRYEAKDFVGALEPKDQEWTCAGSFATETQIFYTLAEDGTSFWCQVIHSSVGLWYPVVQFTCKIFNPKTNVSVWKSINVTNFTTPPPGLDKRSCKADQFSITYKSQPDSDYPEAYLVTANLGTDLQLSLEVQRPAVIPGWKLGKGPKGGFSYFGPDESEGYVVHRFWPRYKASGHIIHNGHATPVQGPGMFVHAIQGMRANLVAQSWNFAHFQSDQHGGCSAIQMEFKTQNTHGKKGHGSGGVTVNVGSVVVGGKLVCVTAETKWPGESSDGGIVSRATHLNPVHDPDTGYGKPSEILFEWLGPSTVPSADGTVKASIKVDLGDVEHPKGLIEKVDVLAEIPYAIKMVVNYVAGTKPYIYQWLNPATLSVSGPESIIPGSSIQVEGLLYNEATFIS